METPNQLSREAIDEFRSIYEEEFGKRLTDGEVKDMARRLLCFFGVLTQQNQDEAVELGSSR